MTFKIGDQVQWTSQAGGHTVTKEGTIFEIVAAKERPVSKLKQPGFPRDHESYVVLASKDTDRKRTAFYWPLVKNLKKKFEVFNEQTLRDEIVRVWGPTGTHVEIYDALLKRAAANTMVPPPAPQSWPGHPGEAG